MLISVLVPTYNRTRLLVERAIPSILAQDGDFEVLVIGDGSERATQAAVEAVADRRVRYWNLPRAEYPEDHQGRWWRSGVHSLNFGLDRAAGDLISVVNDDDELEPHAFRTLLGRYSAGDVDFVYGIADTYKAGQRIGQQYGKWPPGEGALCQGSYLYRASLGYRYDWDAPDRGLPCDGDMWERMAAGGVRFAFVPEVVMRYHRNYP